MGAMTDDQLRAIALGMPDAEERETWGHPTFRVNDKIFVALGEDGTTARIKTSSDEQAALIADDPTTFGVSPYVGRHGWVEVQLQNADPDEVRELIVDAWRRTAPKRTVAKYDEK